MCGIAGWFDRQIDLRETENILGAMLKTMECRGPDAEGRYVEPSIALLHRRLSVIDVEQGQQPMEEPLGEDRLVIVYNGELYNTAELRQELQENGHHFRTRSDTEVVLKSYLHWGRTCVQRFNGIFAFAIWDTRTRKLFLARDRAGVKPLFFSLTPGGIVFASEIKTLLKNPLIRPEIDQDGLCEIFLMGPGRTPGQGVFRQIRELLPGEAAEYDGEHLRRAFYYRLQAHEHTLDLPHTIDYLRCLLTDAVERQLVSDVPLCCFLSGGLDSSIISHLAAAHHRRCGLPPIDTYSVDYAENDRYFEKSLFQPTPDSAFIGTMVESIASNHHEVVVQNADLFEALIPAERARDLPGMTDVDASLLLFCAQIKRDFSVALSGECADELFGGYPWYHRREILLEDCFPWSRSLEVRRSILKKGLFPQGEAYVRQRYEDTCRRTDKLPTDDPIEARMREMFCLNYYWFMQTLLDRKDRMSMKNGLEVRVPFCDYRIVDLAYNLPWSMKALGGREKGIVREAFRGILPDSIRGEGDGACIRSEF